MKTDGTVINQYILPGNDQEGIALDTSISPTMARIFMAEDAGPEVWSYSNYPIEKN